MKQRRRPRALAFVSALGIVLFGLMPIDVTREGVTTVLPKAVAAPLVQTFTGTVQQTHEDDLDHDTEVPVFFLNTGTETLELKVPLPPPLPPGVPHSHEMGGLAHDLEHLSGQGAAVRGVRSGTLVYVDSVEAAASPPGSFLSAAELVKASAVGPTRLLVMMANYQSDPAQPYTVAQVNDAVFGTTGQTLNSYYQELSAGAISFSGEIRGWYTLPAQYTPQTCERGGWMTAAKNMARSAGVDVDSYDRYLLIMSRTSCDRRGLASYPNAWSDTLDYRVIGHEIGHTFQLAHANGYTCKNTAGVTVSYGASCESHEYDDEFDLMGRGDGQFDVHNKNKLGLIGASHMQTVTTTGAYTVVPNEDINTPGIQMLRVPRKRNGDGTVADYFVISLRARYGLFDTFPPDDPALKGVLVRIAPLKDPDVPGDSQLLDATPNTPGQFKDAPLAPGMPAIVDNTGGVSISTVAVAGGQAQVQVTFFTPPRPTVRIAAGTLEYRAPTDQQNDVTFTQTAANQFTVFDAATTLTPGAGCVTQGAAVRCTGTVTRIDADANDGDDTIAVTGTTPATLKGNTGDDTLTGGDGADTIDGGPGHDHFDYLSFGRNGGDTYIGGSGYDLMDYATRSDSVTVRMGNGLGDDGETGEFDNIGNDVEHLFGGINDDVLYGTDNPDEIYGEGGDDFIDGRGGWDLLSGGCCQDFDTVSYATRTTPIQVTMDRQYNDGAESDNVLDAERVVGGSGNDTFTTPTAPDDDVVFEGGPGDDTMLDPKTSPLKPRGDEFHGGAGTDTVSYDKRTASVTMQPGTATNGEVGENDLIDADVENLTGGAGPDTLVGTASPNVIRGGFGADVLSGGGGIDTVDYADHKQSTHVDVEGDRDDGGNEDWDYALGQPARDRVATDFENVTGGAANDDLVGNDLANVLVGGAGNDGLTGFGANDVFDGGSGADIFDGGLGTDEVTYQSRTTEVRAWIDGVANDGGDANGDGIFDEADNIKPGVENIRGGQFTNVLVGDDNANMLVSNSAPLNGVAPVSWLLGNGGTDILIASNVNSLLLGNAGSDYLFGADGFDSLDGGPGADYVAAGANDDTIAAADGNADSIGCGGGYDTVTPDFFATLRDSVSPDCEVFSLGGWGGAVDAAGIVNAGGDAASWGSGRVDQVYRTAASSSVKHRWKTCATCAWQTEDLGGVVTEDPSITTWGVNRLDVFGRGGDNQLYVKTYACAPTCAWGAWQNISNDGSRTLILTSAPDASQLGPNRLAVFARGSDNKLWARTYNGSTWTAWLSAPDTVASGPGAGYAGTAGKAEVFAVNSVSALVQQTLDCTAACRFNSTWTSHSGIAPPTCNCLVGDPDVASTGTNNLDVLVTGSDHGIYWHTMRAGAWLPGFKWLGITVGPDVGVTSSAPGTMQLFSSRFTNNVFTEMTYAQPAVPPPS